MCREYITEPDVPPIDKRRRFSHVFQIFLHLGLLYSEVDDILTIGWVQIIKHSSAPFLRPNPCDLREVSTQSLLHYGLTLLVGTPEYYDMGTVIIFG